MLNFQSLLEKAAAHNPSIDKNKLRKVFDDVFEIYSDHLFCPDQDFLHHVFKVTQALLFSRPDETTFIASLLHGVTESVFSHEMKHTVHSFNIPKIKEIEAKYGKDVTLLISRFHALNTLKFSGKKSESESLRKMFLVMAEDIRVVFLKLAHRLVDMEELAFQPLPLRYALAEETRNIYVPIAGRFGMYRFKNILEDMCFQYLNTDSYDHLKSQFDDYLLKTEKNIHQIRKELVTFLKRNQIEAQVSGRIKNLYSIFKKLKIKNHSSLFELYDIFAMRIVLPTKFDSHGNEIIDHLYSVLALLHNKWSALPYRFKDYVAVPKPNGYESLHTAVTGLSGFDQPVEIQIRSQRMHEKSEYGFASHWSYKDHQTEPEIRNYENWIDLFANIRQNFQKKYEQKSSEFKSELSQSCLKPDFLYDRIFVLTPQGEIKELPQGATPLDFAYSLHSDLGHHCHIAKVNGAIVSLDYQLKNGETVEIISNTNIEPKPHWLSFVKTHSARSKIRSYFRSLDSERSLKSGKELVNSFLKRLQKPLLDEDFTVLKFYSNKYLSLKERIALLEEIGNGSVSAIEVLKKIFREGFLLKEKQSKTGTGLRLKSNQNNHMVLPEQILITGQGGHIYRFGKCCKPQKGSEIFAYVSRQNCIMIHLKNCKVLKIRNSSRVIEASWSLTASDL